MLRNCSATLLSGLLLVAPFVSPALAQEQAERPPRPAKILTVTERPREMKISQPIIVEPLQSAVLTVLEGGILEELPVREGDIVGKGDLIARVDTRILENNVNQARSQLAQAKVEFSRAEILLQQDNISKSVYDQRATEYELAELNVEAAEKRFWRPLTALSRWFMSTSFRPWTSDKKLSPCKAKPSSSPS